MENKFESHDEEGAYTTSIKSLDDLLERDKQRENDGFPRKIKLGQVMKPTKDGKKIIIVPSTEEDKFYQIDAENKDKEGSGSGDGDEGDVTATSPMYDKEGDIGDQNSGEENHELESTAYDIGKTITEKFELPNIQNKGRKKSLTKFTYDLTDKNQGSGQILDKKSTLAKILKTNIALGRIPINDDIDTSNLIISPKDKVYRTLSKEKDYESQALVFFMRDYSGSMYGKRAKNICTQHLLIYSWLSFQYNKKVESRFILHDNKAKEVSNFYKYFNSQVAGTTMISSAFKLTNNIIKNENLEKDYNIYIFYGTDGDNFSDDEKDSMGELKKMMGYSNRVGLTIINDRPNTTFEKNLKSSKLLLDTNILKMDKINENVEESRLISGIKKLIL